MTNFHQGHVHHEPKWIDQTPGERDNDLPGPWPDINRNSVRQSTTPYLIETNGKV